MNEKKPATLLIVADIRAGEDRHIIDVVTDCENGRLVSTNNPSELADVIDELFADEDLRGKLARAGRQTIIEKFTLQGELEGNLALYRRLGLKT